MSDVESVVIKASLHDRTWGGKPLEIRRFTVDQVTARSYSFLLDQVKRTFPSLTDKEDLTLAWIGEGVKNIVADELSLIIHKFYLCRY